MAERLNVGCLINFPESNKKHEKISYSDTIAPLLQENLGADWEVLVWDPARHRPSEFPALAARADAIVGGGIPVPEWPATPRLKVFQIPWTGYDFTGPEKMPDGVPVCNTFEHEVSIAEYVMLAVLEWRIGLRRMDAGFRAAGWNGKLPATAWISRRHVPRSSSNRCVIASTTG